MLPAESARPADLHPRRPLAGLRSLPEAQDAAWAAPSSKHQVPAPPGALEWRLPAPGCAAGVITTLCSQPASPPALLRECRRRRRRCSSRRPPTRRGSLHRARPRLNCRRTAHKHERHRDAGRWRGAGAGEWGWRDVTSSSSCRCPAAWSPCGRKLDRQPCLRAMPCQCPDLTPSSSCCRHAAGSG